jgi:hypothetical protein
MSKELQQILLIIDMADDLYHAGQIQLLKKLWKEKDHTNSTL